MSMTTAFAGVERGLMLAITTAVLGMTQGCASLQPVPKPTVRPPAASPRSLSGGAKTLQAMLDEVAGDLRQAANPLELKRLEGWRFVATDSVHVRDTGATYSEKTITVTVGYMEAAISVVDGMLLGNALSGGVASVPPPNGAFDDYLRQAVKRTWENEDREAAKKKPLAPYMYDEHVALPEDRATALRKRLEGPYTVGLWSVLALTLAHECGHVVLGHSSDARDNATEAQKFKREIEADREACRWLVRLQTKPHYRFIGRPSFYAGLLVRRGMEEERELAKSMPDATLAEWRARMTQGMALRAVLAMDAAIAQCKTDPVFQKMLASDPTFRAEWERVVASYQGYKDGMIESGQLPATVP